jgi:hypothetical protein
MRRLIVLFIFCVGTAALVSGCFRDILLDSQETREEYDKIKTYVSFANAGNFAVDVFADPDRLSKICSVEAESSSTVEVIPDLTVNDFYLKYQISFHDTVIPYSKKFMSLYITPAATTRSPIPPLTELPAGEQEEKFTEDIYIVMNNKSSSSLNLIRGGTPINLAGSSSHYLNAQTSGVYILPANQLMVSSYTFYHNNQAVQWPGEISGNFEKGNLYSLEFSTSAITLVGQWEITIAHALDQAQ